MLIGYLVLGVCLLLAVLLAANWFVNADPKQLARLLRYLGVGLSGAAGVVSILTGRFFIGVPLLALAMMIWRGKPLNMPGMPPGGFRKPSAGQSSKVETEYLSMTLEHETGVMAGHVLKGAYAGKNLAELDLEQLVALFSECYRDDVDSAQLLETYLDRTIGPNWREAAQTEGDRGDARSSRGWGPRQQARAPMTKDEAREVLGVPPDASPAEVKEAYRRLMQKLHPDQGGSTYLAAKINQAKDVLLKV